MSVIFIDEDPDTKILRKRCVTCASVRGHLSKVEEIRHNKLGEQFTITHYDSFLICGSPPIKPDGAKIEPPPPTGSRVEKTEMCPDGWISARKKT